MVETPGEYIWSSYHHNALGKNGPNSDWIHPHSEYCRLGRESEDREGTYRALYASDIFEEELKEIRECSHKGWALGSDRLRKKIEQLYQRRAVSKGVGRPKKRRLDENQQNRV